MALRTGRIVPPETRSPIVYLDVDGVIAPYGVPSWPSFGDWAQHSTTAGEVVLSRGLARAIDEATQGNQVVWLTTWGDVANEILCPLLGWNTMPIRHRFDAPDPEAIGLPAEAWWKWCHVANDAVVSRRPVVWCDDDIAEYGEVEEFIAWRARLALRLLIIAPNPEIGLTPDHVKEIAQFIRQNATKMA